MPGLRGRENIVVEVAVVRNTAQPKASAPTMSIMALREPSPVFHLREQLIFAKTEGIIDLEGEATGGQQHVRMIVFLDQTRIIRLLGMDSYCEPVSGSQS